jgi:mannose-6-phosphate isomerase-like protein (cupin superfamily)
MGENSLPKWMSNYPNPYKQKKVVLTRPNQYLAQTFGNDQNTMRSRIYFSTDKLTVGRFQVMPGCRFDPSDIHAGDEVYYILSGTAYIFNPTTGNITIAKKGEMVNIPKNVWHQAFNFSDEILDVLCFVAPEVWNLDLKNLIDNYKEKPKFF